MTHIISEKGRRAGSSQTELRTGGRVVTRSVVVAVGVVVAELGIVIVVVAGVVAVVVVAAAVVVVAPVTGSANRAQHITDRSSASADITQVGGYYIVQGHSRSLILVPTKSLYVTSY